MSKEAASLDHFYRSVFYHHLYKVSREKITKYIRENHRIFDGKIIANKMQLRQYTDKEVKKTIMKLHRKLLPACLLSVLLAVYTRKHAVGLLKRGCKSALTFVTHCKRNLGNTPIPIFE